MATLTTTNGRLLKEILRCHGQWVGGGAEELRCVLDGETFNEAQLGAAVEGTGRPKCAREGRGSHDAEHRRNR